MFIYLPKKNDDFKYELNSLWYAIYNDYDNIFY